jgi:hypothetical protein
VDSEDLNARLYEQWLERGYPKSLAHLAIRYKVQGDAGSYQYVLGMAEAMMGLPNTNYHHPAYKAQYDQGFADGLDYDREENEKTREA